MKALKRLAGRILAKTPWEIRRKALPERLDVITLALAYFVTQRENINFVQIGACDGVANDPVHKILMGGKLRAVLLEPIEYSYNKLRDTYGNVPNITTVQAALGKTDGTAKMYKVRDSYGEKRDYNELLRLCSFSKSHLLKARIAPEDIEEVTVRSLTLSTLIKESGMESIDVLQIDAEGFDAEVVKMALQLPTLPKYIFFEHMHLDSLTREQLSISLKEKGYDWINERVNTVAVLNSEVKLWGTVR